MKKDKALDAKVSTILGTTSSLMDLIIGAQLLRAILVLHDPVFYKPVVRSMLKHQEELYQHIAEMTKAVIAMDPDPDCQKQYREMLDAVITRIEETQQSRIVVGK